MHRPCRNTAYLLDQTTLVVRVCPAVILLRLLLGLLALLRQARARRGVRQRQRAGRQRVISRRRHTTHTSQESLEAAEERRRSWGRMLYETQLDEG